MSPPRPTGSVNIIGLLLLAGVVLGIWWLIIIGPTYMDNLDVKQAVAEAGNQIRLGKSDEAAASHIIQQTRNVGDHLADDESGNTEWMPGLGLTPEHISVERDQANGTVTIRVEYDRLRILKPLDKEKRVHFVVEEVGSLSQ